MAQVGVAQARADERGALVETTEPNAELFREFACTALTIENMCDERGLPAASGGSKGNGAGEPRALVFIVDGMFHAAADGVRIDPGERKGEGLALRPCRAPHDVSGDAREPRPKVKFTPEVRGAIDGRSHREGERRANGERVGDHAARSQASLDLTFCTRSGSLPQRCFDPEEALVEHPVKDADRLAAGAMKLDEGSAPAFDGKRARARRDEELVPRWGDRVSQHLLQSRGVQPKTDLEHVQALKALEALLDARRKGAIRLTPGEHLSSPLNASGAELPQESENRAAWGLFALRRRFRRDSGEGGGASLGNGGMSLPQSDAEPAATSLLDSVNAAIDSVVNVPIGGIPLLVLWLGAAGLIFTVWMRFVNLRAFGHAIAVVLGRHDDGESQEGDVSHAQALWTALSGTLGLGNIAGVVIAIGIGGPGATFWMVICGFFGMTLKFVECALGQMYRVVDSNGRISGGPMHYLPKGLAEQGWPTLGKVLGVTFAVVCVFSSFGAGNLFQMTQATAVLRSVVPAIEPQRWVLGLVFAGVVGAVTLGGIQSISKVAARVVPLMCALYLLLVVTVLVMHADRIPAALGSILSGAWSVNSAYGGIIGVLVAGMTRATFSNEAGTGSAAIAHSAATTDEPIRGGIVALLEPFIDTVVVCTMTATMVLVLGVTESTDPAVMQAMDNQEGATALMLLAGAELAWSKVVLVVAIVSFALSTVLTWSYYGERCVRHLMGARAVTPYRLLFVAAVYAGAVVEAESARAFADLAFLSLAFPNVLGLYFLGGKVRAELKRYLERRG